MWFTEYIDSQLYSEGYTCGRCECKNDGGADYADCEESFIYSESDGTRCLVDGSDATTIQCHEQHHYQNTDEDISGRTMIKSAELNSKLFASSQPQIWCSWSWHHDMTSKNGAITDSYYYGDYGADNGPICGGIVYIISSHIFTLQISCIHPVYGNGEATQCIASTYPLPMRIVMVPK